MAGRQYGTDPYGIIAKGNPSQNGDGLSVNFGSVGNSVRDYSSPGRTVGGGVGVTLSVPMKTKSKAKGGAIKEPGLYANINAKRERIANGSGEKMRKPGSKGAPTADAFKQSAKTASSGDRQVKAYGDMIKKAAGGAVQTSSDTARKLATEMGGMSKGGRTSKMDGGPISDNTMATKLEMGQPSKLARGGAGKVRKGMMSPQGAILQAVKPKKGVM
jgi:hypothetical protein